MTTENKIHIADAKELYLRWNKSQFENILSTENSAFELIQLIPLFMHLNDKLLPGYVNSDTPVGVFGYRPDKKIVYQAKQLNSKFRYKEEGLVKYFAVDAVMFQQQLVDKKNRCWIFHRSDLNTNQLVLLQEKIDKISNWFSTRGFKLEFICLSDDDFRKNRVEQLEQINKTIFLDYFYSEIILLGGKYPVWWLVPPSKEFEYPALVEHIKQARFVDSEEFIDLGGMLELNREDAVRYAVDLVQKIKQAPEICLVKLLIADHKNIMWPEADGISIQLKYSIYESGGVTNPVDIMAHILRDTLSYYSDKNHILSPLRLFSRLRNISGKLNIKIVDAFLADNYIQEPSSTGIDNLIVYLNFFKAVSYEVHQIFFNIVENYITQFNERDIDQALKSVAQNMLVFLSDDADRVPLYNTEEKVDIILDRILLKHEIISDEEGRWSLVLKISEGNEKTIDGFGSLLGLLAWCWLNRVVNNSTQVSIDCPRQQVKQIEAHFVLETLIQQLNPRLLSSIPPEAFENPVRPLQSLLFINFMTTNKNEGHQVLAENDQLSFGTLSENQLTHCEQLIVNSWGDVHTKQYSGNSGILKCLCDWTHHAPLDGLAKPQQLRIFGYGVGDSTFMAQRVEQVYEEMQSFFYSTRQQEGRFILRMGLDYHVIKIVKTLLQAKIIGRKQALMEYLETTNKKFQITALERLAFTEFPLREIYQNNKENVVQVFFQIINRSCYSWVLDEKGSLWSDGLKEYDRESYITHWLYFFKNIRNRLKDINVQEQKMPTLEINQISINQLGGIEFYHIGSEAVSGNKNFIDILISIKAGDEGDELSLVCDGHRFDYQELNQNVLIESVQYLSDRITEDPGRLVFVTDIDAPLRIFNAVNCDDIQISQILKVKRNFEHRINKLLSV